MTISFINELSPGENTSVEERVIVEFWFDPDIDATGAWMARDTAIGSRLRTVHWFPTALVPYFRVFGAFRLPKTNSPLAKLARRWASHEHEEGRDLKVT